eukprot:jgi/Tetstr1/438855/TSEL_027364.t1
MWGGLGGDAVRRNGTTPRILQAVRAGDAAAVLRAMRDGLDPSAPDEGGRTALSVAAELGDVHVVKALLQDPNLPLNQQDQLGRTPLAYAASGGHAAALQVLLAEGGDPGLQDLNRCTPLLYAAAGGHAACVALLASAGVDVNHCDQGGHSSLMLSSAIGDTETVDHLLARAAHPDIANKEGTTALMFACMAGNTEVVQLLVGAGANVEAQDGEGLAASDMTGDADIRGMLRQAAARCSLYRHRFSSAAKSSATPFGCCEIAEDIVKGVMVELRFYESQSRRDAVLARLRGLSSDFVANLPVEDWIAEAPHYVFTDADRHHRHPHCMVVTAGEQSLEEVLREASMMSFMETMHIFRSMLEAVQHLHLRNVVHCNLTPACFSRFYDGAYRIVDVHDSRSGSEFYLQPNLEEDMALNTVPPELAGFCRMRNCTSQVARRARDMWSLGALLLYMLTGETLAALLRAQGCGGADRAGAELPDAGQAPQKASQPALRAISELQQDTVQSLSQDFLRKSLRTHAARFPEARQYVSGMEGAGLPERVLESLAKRSPPIRRLAELHKLLTRLLAVSPQDRPTCAQVLQCPILKLTGSAPSLKAQELVKLQAATVEAEARQLAIMEEMATDLKLMSVAAIGDGSQQHSNC